MTIEKSHHREMQVILLVTLRRVEYNDGVGLTSSAARFAV